MADDLFDVITLLFAVLLFGMGLSQIRRPIQTESAFHSTHLPESRPGSVRAMGYLLVIGSLMFLTLCVLGISGVMHLGY